MYYSLFNHLVRANLAFNYINVGTIKLLFHKFNDYFMYNSFKQIYRDCPFKHFLCTEFCSSLLSFVHHVLIFEKLPFLALFANDRFK